MVPKPRNKTLYTEARLLRQKGLSYGVIAKQCTTSKSNISLWCRDIELSESQTNKLFDNKKKSLQLGSKRLHELRKSEILKVRNAARIEIPGEKMDDFTFQTAGTMLYWAEGCKTNGLYIANSDERIILFMIKWFKKFLQINVDRMRVYLHLHDKDDDAKIKEYWSRLTGIPLQNFGKSFVKTPGTGHRKNILPHGIIRIQICGKGIENLRHRIMTWVEQIYNIEMK